MELEWHILFIISNRGSRNVKNPTSAAGTAMLNVCEEGLECTFFAFIVPLSIHMLEDSFLRVKISLIKVRKCLHICKYVIDVVSLISECYFTCRTLTLRCLFYVDGG